MSDSTDTKVIKVPAELKKGAMQQMKIHGLGPLRPLVVEFLHVLHTSPVETRDWVMAQRYKTKGLDNSTTTRDSDAELSNDLMDLLDKVQLSNPECVDDE